LLRQIAVRAVAVDSNGGSGCTRYPQFYSMEWYRKVLGMTLVHRSAAPVGGQQGRRGLSKIGHCIGFKGRL